MADSMDAARYTVDGDHGHNDRSNFRQAPRRTGTDYSSVESIRINDTMFHGKIFRSVQVEQTIDPLGGSRLDLKIGTTIHGAGGFRKMLSESGHRAMVLIITHPNGRQTICREVCVMEMKMDVRVGFTAKLQSRSLPAELLSDEPEEKVRPEPLQIIIDDQMIPLEHCDAHWSKSPPENIYNIAIEISDTYMELDTQFSTRSKPTIKIRYPDVELTFIGDRRQPSSPHRNTEKRMFQYVYKGRLINERKIKTQKPELF